MNNCEFGIEWNGITGTPTQAFWNAWRSDKWKLIDRGYRVSKIKGKWYVSRAERSAKARVADAKKSRYARYTKYV